MIRIRMRLQEFLKEILPLRGTGRSTNFTGNLRSCRRIFVNFFDGWDVLATILFDFGADPEQDPDPEIKKKRILQLQDRAYSKNFAWCRVIGLRLLLTSCAGGRHNMPPPPASWPLTFWPWKWCPSHVCQYQSSYRRVCSRLRPDVRDRQTDVRRASSLNASALWGGGIISDAT